MRAKFPTLASPDCPTNREVMPADTLGAQWFLMKIEVFRKPYVDLFEF